MFKLIFQKKGISLEKLNLMCDVARTGGIRSAVGDDSSRQSLASRQLKELSDYVGAPLFRHAGRSIAITEHGQRLVEICENFFGELEGYLKSIQNLPDIFKLGVGDAIFQWYLLPRMHEFRSSDDNIELRPMSLPTEEIIRKVSSGELDAGLIRHSTITNQDVTCVVIGEIKYKFFVPRKLIHGQQRNNSTPSPKNLPLCTLTGNGVYSQSMSTLLTSLGASPQLTCSSTTQIYGAVQSGQYAAILPERAQKGFSSDILSFTMTELAAFTRKISLIYKHSKQQTPSHIKTIDFLRTVIS